MSNKGKASRRTGPPLSVDEYNNQMTYLIFKKWKMLRRTKMIICAVLLFLSAICERYFFFVSVYKTKYYGYVLILTVFFFNAVFSYINQRLRKERHKRRLHEMFNIERTPKIGLCLIGFIG